MAEKTISEKITTIVFEHNPVISNLYGHEDFIKENNQSMIDKLKGLFGEKVPTGETTSIIQVHAVMNFFFAHHNIDRSTLIRRAFLDKIAISDVHHLEEKFIDSDYRLFSFIERIDEEKRGILIRYIMENYNGVSIESIKKYYFA